MPFVKSVLSYLKSNYVKLSDESNVCTREINSNIFGESELIFCKNNICVHSLNRCDEKESIHCPGYLKITVKHFVDQYNQVRRPTLFLDWIPNYMLKNKLSCSDYSFRIENDCSMAEFKSYEIGMERDLKSFNPFLSNEIKNSQSHFQNSEEDISVAVDLANPKINIVSSPLTETVMTIFEAKSIGFEKSDNDNQLVHKPEFYSNISSPIFPNRGFSETSKKLIRRFSVDLSYMRSLRLFFKDDSCTSGQLVIISRESQYKVLHFHHGSLDRLAQILQLWHSSLHAQQLFDSKKKTKDFEEPFLYQNFILVCRPEISSFDMHPEEGKLPKLTNKLFAKLLNQNGQIEDDLFIKKIVFFSGIEKSLRKSVWPFLLEFYSYQTTFDQRLKILHIKKQEYENITKRRKEITGSKLIMFKQNIENTIEKDVIRTDRENPFFAGIGNKNLDKMKNILLNYAVHNATIGYKQGMSEILAPILCEIEDEVTTFWCFAEIIQRRAFVATPVDQDMDNTLKRIKELIKIMLPKFYNYIDKQKNSSEMLFCHRWILLYFNLLYMANKRSALKIQCFKREFTESVVLKMWEACWSNYLTNHFNLFLCLAIISMYADDIIKQNLKPDEMLLYFSSLAMYMDGKAIIQKARGLFYKFGQMTELPCTLADIYKTCQDGVWDALRKPKIYCVCHQDFFKKCFNISSI